MSSAPSLATLAVAIAAAGACTSDPAKPAELARDFASGARLEAQAYRIDGSVEVLRYFLDRMRGEPCAFVDGTTKNVGPSLSHFCLPLGMARHDEGIGPYADALCSTPVALPSEGSEPAYAIVHPVDTCASAPVVRKTLPPKQLRPYVRQGRSCVRSATPVTIAPLGDEVPITSFVRGHEEGELRGDGRIGALVIVGDDGARQTIGGWDRTRVEAVRLEEDDTGGGRWVPARTAFVGAGPPAFADDGCANTVATKSTRDAECPLSAALVFSGTCGRGTFHLLGAPIAESQMRTMNDQGACVALENEGASGFTLGETIADGAFESARLVEVGAGRLRRRGFSSGVGAVAVTWRDVFDAQLGEACEVDTATDGTLRCLPAASAELAYFADAQCRSPAFAIALTGCDDRFPKHVRARSAEGVRAFEVTGDVATLFVSERGVCTPFEPRVPSRAFAVREIDPSHLARATEETLP